MKGYKSVSIREEIVEKIQKGAKDEKKGISFFLNDLIEDKAKRIKKINALEELGKSMEEALVQIPTKEEIRKIVHEELKNTKQ